MRAYSLETQCTLILARIAIMLHRENEAAELLDSVEPDTEMRALGFEIQAQVKFWRSRLTKGTNKDLADARNAIQQLLARLPEELRDGFKSRPAIREIVQ
jgi:hypothetical protein